MAGARSAWGGRCQRRAPALPSSALRWPGAAQPVGRGSRAVLGPWPPSGYDRRSPRARRPARSPGLAGIRYRGIQCRAYLSRPAYCGGRPVALDARPGGNRICAGRRTPCARNACEVRTPRMRDRRRRGAVARLGHDPPGTRHCRRPVWRNDTCANLSVGHRYGRDRHPASAHRPASSARSCSARSNCSRSIAACGRCWKRGRVLAATSDRLASVRAETLYPYPVFRTGRDIA